MKSSEKQKLSLTPSILKNSGFQTIKYCLPSALSTFAEYETTGNLTSGEWRLYWRSCDSAALVNLESGQKSVWNALHSCSSQSACHSLLNSVAYICDYPVHTLSICKQQCEANLSHLCSNHASFTISLFISHVHTRIDQGLLDTIDYLFKRPSPHVDDSSVIATQSLQVDKLPCLTSSNIVVNTDHAGSQKCSKPNKPYITFTSLPANGKKYLRARLQNNVHHAVLSLFQFFLLIACVGGNHIFTPSQFSSQDDVLSNLYYIPRAENNPSKADIPGQVYNQEELGIPQPSRAELRERTPSYMFDLHSRHEKDWWDFDQFNEGHLKHPLHFQNPLGTVKTTTNNLGTVTAIRHHQHIATEDHGSKLLRVRRSANPVSVHASEHSLFFKLADMPENEQLLAASIRLRYVPQDKWNRTTVNTKCQKSTQYHKWPITVWLTYGSPTHSDVHEVKTIGSFEPDVDTCGETTGGANKTLIHFPAGWFNLPLNEAILRMLQEVNLRSIDSSKGTESDSKDERVISIRVRTMVSYFHYPTNTEQVLRLRKPNNTGRNEQMDSQWLHEAPHLFTFHRDPVLVEHVKRSRRSALQPGSIPSAASTSKQTKESLRTKVQNGSLFLERYKKLQQLLQSKLNDGDRKRRPRRRAYYQRRQSRSSHDKWRSSANTYQYRQQSSSTGYMDQRSTHPRRYSKEGYRRTGVSASGGQYGYEPSASLNMDLNMNSPNYLESLCQRRELIIDFAAVGWAGWVIAPTSYNARYCYGQCPFPLSTHYNTTNHAVLLQLVHLLDAARIPGPCCVPNQLSPQSLLYHTQTGDVVLRVYQDMVVESCACR